MILLDSYIKYATLRHQFSLYIILTVAAIFQLDNPRSSRHLHVSHFKFNPLALNIIPRKYRRERVVYLAKRAIKTRISHAREEV